MSRIIIFGTGRHLKKTIGYLTSDIEIVAFADNNRSLWGHEYLGKIIISPVEIPNYGFDFIVIATNKYYSEINQQLIEMGVSPEQIYSLEIFLAKQRRGHISLYGTEDSKCSAQALLISTDLNYNGGTLACVYAAQALKKDYKNVCIAAPTGNLKLIREINELGITAAIAPALLAPGPKELALAKDAEFVLVNVYQSIAAACEFSRVKPVVWWIHECCELIDVTNEYYHCDYFTPYFSKIHTVAVCRNVQDNLKKAWPDLPVSIMNYGLPDFYKPGLKAKGGRHSVIFAIVGGVIYLKAQDVFVKAAVRYNEICRNPAEFWIIGSGSESEYFTEVMNIANGVPNITWKGELSREQLEDIYPQIDVIVCPSRQEGIPIVVNEGLMNAKVCIVADTAGDNDYIVDGESGLFFHGEDVEELANKMTYVAENYESLKNMRQKARQVFIDHYSMESFRLRLEREIASTIAEWKPMEADCPHSIFCCQDQL